MLPKLGLRKNNPNIDIGIGWYRNRKFRVGQYRISAKKPISDIPTKLSTDQIEGMDSPISDNEIRQAVATVASQKGLEVEQVRGRDPRLLEEGAELSAAQIPLHFLFRYVQKHEDRSAIFPNMPTAFIGVIPHLPSAIPTILHVFRWFAMKHTRKCISFRKCGKCFREKWGWKYVLVKQPSSRRKEMFDGLNQVKGFEQSKWSKQCKPAHHLKINVGNK